MKKSVMKTFVVACGLVFSANVLANDASKKEYDELSRQGREACENGDYYSALAFYEKAAKTRYGRNAEPIFGIGGAEWDRYQLGSMYEKGRCIGAKTQQGTPNYAKALEWYEEVIYASKADDLLKQYNAKFKIAMIYWLGEGGVEKDGAKARRLFKEVANIPDKLAEEKVNGEYTNKAFSFKETRGNGRLMLDRMHYYGISARQDYALAYQWSDKGRQDGSDYAAELLAVLRYNGWGTQQNKASATRIMGVVCDMGNSQRACDLYKEMKANHPIDY